jgi:hypothetical protein
VRDWTWNEVAEPGCSALSPRGLEWELSRYRAYLSRLADRPVGPTFRVASSFLIDAAATAAPLAEAEALR